jgi:hypothetical protein
MDTRFVQTLPKARVDRLIVRELADELIVYDLDREKALCLNEASAIVWRHCDGKSTVAEAKRSLEKSIGTSIDEDVVWLALNQLRKSSLLDAEGNTGTMWKVSRRDVALKYLPAALALPVILSIAAPTKGQAASAPCVATGNVCNAATNCCNGCNLNQGVCM